MSLKATYEFLFVGRDDNSFLENYYYDLFQDHGERGGQIFINLEVQGNPVDAEEIGSMIFQTMQKGFFEDVNKDPYDRFEYALKLVNKTLSVFQEQKVSNYIGDLNVIIAATVGDQLFVTQTGEAEAYLVRKRYVSVVSEGLSDDKGDEIFSSIASGQIEVGDFVLFSSTRLLRYIGKTDLAQSVHRKDIVESLDDIKDSILTEILGRVALIGIQFSRVTKSEESALLLQDDTVNKGAMESSENHISVQRETLTGKFFSSARKYKNKVKSTNIDFGKIGSWFSNLYKSLFSKGFGKDKILALLILLIFVLVIGIFFASGKRSDREEIERLDTVLEGVQDRIAEAETKAAISKETAQELLDQAYVDAKSVLDSGDYREKAGLLISEIEEARDVLNGVKRIEVPMVYVNLSEKYEGINPLGFVNVDDKVYIYDTQNIYEIVVDQVQDSLVIDENETVVAATGFDNRNSVVFLTESGKLIEYDGGTMSFMDSEDGSFRKGVKLDDWSNKLYILDNTEGQIWKYTYQASRNAFASPDAYVLDDTDLKSAVDISIDGSIYALSDNSDLMKFYAGNKEEFFINDYPTSSLVNPSALFVEEDSDYAYILDSSENRVMVLIKDSSNGHMNYVSQYLFETDGEIRDLYVEGNVMYLISSAGKLIKYDMQEG